MVPKKASPEADNTGSVDSITVADVIARLTVLKPPRMGEMISALRTACRVLNAEPSTLPAELGSLRRRLAAAAYAVAGIKRGRWNNVRCLTLKALELAGLPTMPGRSMQPLLPSWEAIKALLPDKSSQHSLSRLMSYCSRQQLPPGAVTAEVFERFREALETESLVRDVTKVYRMTCKRWNDAATSVPGWPELLVPLPGKSRRYALPLTDFPLGFQSDTDAYLEHLGDRNPFADDYTRSARPSTVAHRRKQILQTASALISSGFPIAALTSLTVLVEPANAKLALRHFWERAGRKSTTSIHDRAVFLSGLAKHWVKAPADQIGELTKLGRGLKLKKGGMTDKNRERLRQFDDGANVDALLNLPFRVLRQVRQKDASGRDEALRVMFALAVEILIVAPMRINNLTGLRLDLNIVHTRPVPKGVVHIVIPKEEVKNDEPYEMELPRESAELLAVYLKTYRSRLSTEASSWLFPNDEGKRRVTSRFSTSISEFVLRETGIKMNVHLFRHLAATLHLRMYPDDLETARRILGHRSLITTMKFYADIKTSGAFKRYDGMIAATRGSGPPRGPSIPQSVQRSA